MKNLLSTIELANHFGLSEGALRMRLKRAPEKVPVEKRYGNTNMYDPKVVGRMLGLKPARKEP